MSNGTVPEREHIMQFFKYSHLPPHLQDVSKIFHEVADKIHLLPRNPERTIALRKLLESKDAAVRAQLATVSKEETPKPEESESQVQKFIEDRQQQEIQRAEEVDHGNED